MISVENFNNNPPLYIRPLDGPYEITISRNMCALKHKMFEDKWIEMMALLCNCVGQMSRLQYRPKHRYLLVFLIFATLYSSA